MSKVFCKKCGLRADSKCPYSRNVFPSHNPDILADTAQEYFEQFMKVGKADPSDKSEKSEYRVSFWTYAKTDDDATAHVLSRLQQCLATPGFNIKVAGCLHDWELLPGEKCSLGCHVGIDQEVPPDPYGVE